MKENCIRSHMVYIIPIKLGRFTFNGFHVETTEQSKRHSQIGSYRNGIADAHFTGAH